MLKGADESKNKLPNMRKEQIDSLFKGLPRNKDGDVSFHAMQQYASWATQHPQRVHAADALCTTITSE